MFPDLKFRNLCLTAFLCIIVLAAFSCDRRELFSGSYVAEGEENLKTPENVIELKENGQGVWRIADDEATFSWRVTDDEIRLYTKSGGVIIGKMKTGDTLEIALPGSKFRYFKKVN
jgi:hypothetical protein